MAIQQPSPPPAPALQAAVATEPGRYNLRAAAAVGLVVGIVDVLIAARFVLELLGASTRSSFVGAVYAISSPLVGPFRGIFPNSGSGANLFEPAALVAIVVFALVGWGVVMLIRIATAPRGTRPATS